MRVALVHAMTGSVQPIEEAFRKVAPNITLLHFMDTGLLDMLKKHGEITPNIIRRFSQLLSLAIEAEVDVIQLTCSAFNDLTSILQPLYNKKIFRSDEAMLDEALNYNLIGVISTVNATPIALRNYLFEKKSNVQVNALVNENALELLQKGNNTGHDQIIKEMIRNLEKKVEVIVLSQYSMAHVANQVNVSVPILTGPFLTAKRCKEYLQNT
ncbi:hypothetical protein BTR23_09505 [Alkalihalophilus pseudofirmus]|nr:hypothetical protein BTR23_09505 [Alkalihalophilus pseudofirmus]